MMLQNKHSVSLDSGLGSKASDGSEMRQSAFTRTSVDSGFQELDFLFPNGITVSLSCDRNSKLSEIKPKAWELARQSPGARFLPDSGNSVFIGRTVTNTEQEFDNRTRISDLQLVFPVLEVSEPLHSRDMKQLCEQTGKAIGIPVQNIDLADSKSDEQRIFRSDLMCFCRNIAKIREKWEINDKLHFFFPAKMDLNPDLPLCTELKLLEGNNPLMDMKVWLREEGQSYEFGIKFKATDTPQTVIQSAVRARSDSKGHDEDTKRVRVQDATTMYVLKVASREEYMLHEICIHCYEYVRTCINKDEVPQLQIVTMNSLVRSLPENKCLILNQDQSLRPNVSGPEVSDCELSWDVSHEVNYCIKVRSQPGRKNQYVSSELLTEARLYNGDQQLGKVFRTKDHGYNTLWDFEVPIQCLPRTARLCFITFAVQKELNTTKQKSLNWVNMQVFDHNGILRTGEQHLQVFDFSENENVLSYPHGTPGSNCDTIAHYLKFDVMPPRNVPVRYPSDEHVDKITERERKFSISRKTSLFSGLDSLVDKDPLYPLTSKDKQFLWRYREVGLEYAPKLLPKLISAVDWLDRHQVLELHQLFAHPTKGRITSLSTALQLLGPWCQDKKARDLALEWLRKNLNVTQIELYLLQLTQIIKFESYMNNDFVKYILEKALLNRRIGHKFFWLLRAEMTDPVSRGRYAVILEAYCLYCGSAILENRLREVTCLDKFAAISKKVKEDPSPKVLKDWMANKNNTDLIQDGASLMHPSVTVGALVESECKVLTSKMKPIFLTFNSHRDLTEENGKIQYILKNGDDLRQDMLVVQMLKIMDMLWKHSCNDYRTTVYDCLAMNSDIGLIEVVQNAQTICEIERDTKTGPTGSTSLHEWLYQKSKETIGFPDAVDRFTHSCAGFCVSTFLLGIGDRHSDNIMLSEKGKIFNIDFGHFMNHKKSKGMIDRERTPFILTNDFVNIITKGSKRLRDRDSPFEKFLFLCFEAYMTIRTQSDLFLTLLSLMMHANLPELNSAKDIDYCRKCLGVDKSDAEAAAFFYENLFKSHKGQWATKINWFCHRFYKAMKS